MPKVVLAGTKMSTFGIIGLFSRQPDAKTAFPVAPPEVCFPEFFEKSELI
jgi:hypothetical protein